MALAMDMADKLGGQKQVDYVNTHGTSTPVGDTMELGGIKKVFTEAGYMPYVGSTKSLSGHALGAAGVHEAIYSLLMVRDGFLAESANITTTIDVSVSFSRKPHSEAWGMILPRVETTGASDFFVNKLQRIVQSVERRGDAFVESLRPLRIAAIMKKAHESRHKTLATNVEKEFCCGIQLDAFY